MDRTKVQIEHLNEMRDSIKNKIEAHSKLHNEIQADIWKLEAEENVEARLGNITGEINERISDKRRQLSDLKKVSLRLDEERIDVIGREIQRLEIL